MFTWYCGYLSARKRAISTTFVLTLLQMYLPDDAVAVGESRPTSSPLRLLLVSSARDSESEQPSSSSWEPADDDQGSPPACWATAAFLGGVSRPRGRRRLASAELRWVRAVPAVCVQTITSLASDKLTISLIMR